MKRTRNGFTLLEILVVVMIITILATIVGVSVARHPGKARIANATAQVSAFKTAINMYRMDNGAPPTQQQGLAALCRKPDSAPIPANYPAEGYMDTRKIPKDPWGREYIYAVPGPDGLAYEILTYGADGEPGGEAENADISSADL